MPPATGAQPRVSLLPHPAHGAGPLAGLTVEVLKTAGGLHLTYRLDGDTTRLRIPPRTTPAPADRLWMHTCCEAFIAAREDTGYREFNFSPGGPWAIYDFSDYRSPTGQRIAPEPPLDIASHHDSRQLTLSVCLPWERLPTRHGEILLGLSCVVEATDGTSTYWAITHPGTRPDFHDRDGFALRLSVPPVHNT